MQLSDFGVTRKTKTTSNGLRVVVYERPHTPISLALPFWGGAKYDPRGQEGLAHFTEHMLLSGTQRYPSKSLLAEAFEQFGGRYNASTSLDSLNIKIDVAEPEDLTIALTLLGEMVSDSIFAPAITEKERGAILAEEGRSIAEPRRHLLLNLRSKLLFQGSRLAREVIGTPSTIAAINHEQLTSFYSELLSRSTTLIASGGTTIEQVSELVETNLEALKPNTRLSSNYKETPMNRNEFSIFHHYDLTQVQLLLAFRTVPAFRPENYALEVLGKILGGSRTSRLHRKLRQDLGLVYSVSAHNWELQEAGVFNVITDCSAQHAQKVVDAITAEIKRLLSDGISVDELEKIKLQIHKDAAFNAQTSGFWTMSHQFEECFNTEQPATYDIYLNSIAKLTPSDIIAVANKFLVQDGWYLAVCGNIKAEDITVNF